MFKRTFFLLLAAASLANAAQAADRHTQVTGPLGQTAQRDVSRSQGDVSSTTTGPQGKSSSRTVERSASGTTATVKGPNGESATRTTTTTHKP